MELLVGCTGLAIAFIILTFLILYLIIETKKHFIIKFIVIALAMWYSVVLLYTPPKLMGWPTNKQMPPNTIILNVLFDEPKPDSKGAIYVLGVTQLMEVKMEVWEQFHYKNIFSYNANDMPRLYVILFQGKP